MTLMGSDAGVFLGIERPDWAFVSRRQHAPIRVRRDRRQRIGGVWAHRVRAWSSRALFERRHGMRYPGWSQCILPAERCEGGRCRLGSPSR